MTTGRDRRGRRWGLTVTVGLLAAVAALAYLLAQQGRGLRAPRTALATVALVYGGALGGIFLRRTTLGTPLTDVPGWRWLDAGSVLYLLASLASFFVLLILMDAEGLPGWSKLLASIGVIMIPMCTWYAVRPRGVESDA